MRRIERGPHDGVPTSSSVMKVFNALTDDQLLKLVRLMEVKRVVSLAALVNISSVRRNRRRIALEWIRSLWKRHRTEDQELLHDVVLPLRQYIQERVLQVVVNGNKPEPYGTSMDPTTVREITDFMDCAAYSMPSEDFTKRLEALNRERQAKKR